MCSSGIGVTSPGAHCWLPLSVLPP